MWIFVLVELTFTNVFLFLFRSLALFSGLSSGIPSAHSGTVDYWSTLLSILNQHIGISLEKAQKDGVLMR
jgi:hypothetical protein